MATAPVVEPKEGVSPAPSVTPTAPEAPETASTSLPDDLIRIPAIQAVLAGAPPAVSASLAEFQNRPEGKVIAANAKPLMDAGFGLYRSLSGDLGVLFNRAAISDNEIMDADKAGKLLDIAPSFDEVSASIGKMGEKHPILNAKPPTGFKTNEAPAVQPAPITPPQPVKPSSQKEILKKASALTPGGPTSGPMPGAGRLLNKILTPVQ